MGRIIYTPFDALSVTNDADQNIWELLAGSANKAILHGWELSSAETSAEAARLRLMRFTTGGTGGTAATEVLKDEDDGSITGAVIRLATTPGTAGDILQAWQWEQLGPVGQLYTPEMRPIVQEAGRIGINLQNALAATRTWSGWVAWEEI